MLSVSISLIAAVLVTALNQPPDTPTVTEPAFDGRVVNPEDVHMETGPFSDPDPGDTHAASDWEIWTVSPTVRVWAASGVTGPEKVHIHLGDGVFEGTHAGRHSLLPGYNYFLRVRHEDSSGDPQTQWSEYAERFFSTASPTSLLPLELDDMFESPPATWTTTGGAAITLPVGAQLRAESVTGGVLVAATGVTGGATQFFNPPPLPSHVPTRIRIIAGGQALSIPPSNLVYTDHDGDFKTIFLPAISLGAGQSAYYWVSSNGSTFAGSAAQTGPDFSNPVRANPYPWQLEPGFVIDAFTTGLQLPVNIVFVQNPGTQPSSPLFYVVELYGKIKVIRRDRSVGTYAEGLLNFDPGGAFPGSGEQGVAGLAIHPTTGDLYATMLYDSAPPTGDHYPKVVRFHSSDGGQTAATQTTILDMTGEIQGQSHQISSASFGPDGKLYIHVGDGFDTGTGLNLDSFRGKILRMNTDGSPAVDNPFYSTANGINARDYVFAYGFRNPFGGVWRGADNQHYEVENGPSVDRLAKVARGASYGYDGSDQSMHTGAIYNWTPSVAPVNLSFIQASTFGGSRFPASKMDHVFVTESGPTWGTGPQELGKIISEFVLDGAGNLVAGPTPFVQYNGYGKATCVGLAAGPDGLYFSDLYQDVDYQTPIDPGANVLRIRFAGEAAFSADVTEGPAPLTVHFTDEATVPSPTEYLWVFGDGATSTEHNPTHVYTREGVFSVRRRVTGAAGAVIHQKNALIRVGRVSSVAMIVGSIPPNAADQAIAARLTAKGFAVDCYDDDTANRPDAQTLGAGHDLVVISSTVAATNIAGEFRDVATPVVFWEQGLLRVGSETLSDNGGTALNSSAITIANNTHPITRGFALGDVQVYQSPMTVSLATGNIAPAATVLARRSGGSAPAILAAEEGAQLLGGYTAPARRVFLFLEDSGYLTATAAAQTLVERSICWAGSLDPVITDQPAETVTAVGGNAAFAVAMSGGGPVTYQWRREGTVLANGGRLSGVTTAQLTITGATAADSGRYDVVITGPCGSIISQQARLTVGCYANCDGSTGNPVLNIYDFICYQERYSAGDPYANCDGSTTPPVLSVSDFMCFVNRYTAGCQ